MLLRLLQKHRRGHDVQAARHNHDEGTNAEEETHLEVEDKGRDDGDQNHTKGGTEELGDIVQVFHHARNDLAKPGIDEDHAPRAGIKSGKK